MANPGEGESSIVKKILHGDHARQIREHNNTIISAGFGRGIAQRGHAFGIVQKPVETLDPGTGRGPRWALGNGIHADTVGFAQVIPKTAGDGGLRLRRP